MACVGQTSMQRLQAAAMIVAGRVGGQRQVGIDLAEEEP